MPAIGRPVATVARHVEALDFREFARPKHGSVVGVQRDDAVQSLHEQPSARGERGRFAAVAVGLGTWPRAANPLHFQVVGVRYPRQFFTAECGVRCVAILVRPLAGTGQRPSDQFHAGRAGFHRESAASRRLPQRPKPRLTVCGFVRERGEGNAPVGPEPVGRLADALGQARLPGLRFEVNQIGEHAGERQRVFGIEMVNRDTRSVTPGGGQQAAG